MSDPAAARAMESDIRRRFWVALALTVAIVVVSPMGRMIGINPPMSDAARCWLLLVLTTPVVFWSGWIFVAGACAAAGSTCPC